MVFSGSMERNSHMTCELAVRYQAPLATVERLMMEEAEMVSRDARVKNFVPIFVARRVEERLRTHSYSALSE